MTKQILAVGDTGLQLVSKFNNNSDDSYNSIADNYNSITAIKAFVFSLTDYGCVGDAVTDNTTAFTTLLSTIGSNQATIKIPSGRFLIGACTIPANIELVFENGGRIIWKTSSTVIIHGHINAGHKCIFEFESQVAETLPLVYCHQQNWISPCWFGLKMSGSVADATTNYNGFRGAWNAAYRGGDVAAGGSIKFPAGECYMHPIKGGVDGFLQQSKYAKISGAGKYKTIIKSASAGCLWDLTNSFDYDVSDLCLSGNNSNGANPVLAVGDYRASFYDVRVTDSSGDGIHCITGANNFNLFNKVVITRIAGWGMIIDAAVTFAVNQIDIESVGLGGILVRDSGIGSTHMSGIITGNYYGEASVPLIELDNAKNVYVNVVSYNVNYGYLVRLINGAHDNTVICKAEDSRTKLEIESGTYDNCIFTDEKITVEDNSFCNSLQKHSAVSPCARPIGSDRSGTYYCNNTTPGYNFDAYDGVLYNNHSVLNGVLCFDPGSPGSPISARFPNLYPVPQTEGNLMNYELDGVDESYDIPATKVYVQILIRGKSGAEVSLRCFDSQDAPTYHYYNWDSETWIDDSNLARSFRIKMNGELQFFSIPIILGEQRKLCFRFRGNSLTYDYVDFYYFNIADRDDADLCHIRAGNVIGWGMNNPIVTSISLPPADEVPVGTDAFCTDLGMKVISDGTNWKKPDGTNLA